MAAERSLSVVPDYDVLSLVGVPEWCDPRHRMVAWVLACGSTKQAAADAGGVDRATVYNWLNDTETGGEFRALIDRLSLHVGIMTKGARARAVNRLWDRVKDAELDVALRKSDALGVLRFAEELGGGGGLTVPLAAQQAQQVIIGTQINVSGNTVMSGPLPGNPGGVVVEGVDVVDVEIVDLGAADPVAVTSPAADDGSGVDEGVNE